MDAAANDGDQLTREVKMKKLLFIIALLAFQVACTTQPPLPVRQGALLSFTDLAGEMTVNYEVTTSVSMPSRTSDIEPGDSS